ncbi:hypothetical protein O4J56_13890 [Nocardiopsis sp. RSe5-2]|uniref:DUF998 domain-containing protein n=1 Tax=Nocardiopsis endophytica TaxID=3018445 RepID=A0ABT4U441_9ACTN|nr:hypothetical protein [Nocardiopsis endophytica]MDA2811728.1 hypothetical protein [Nocardiopsis endophytica]
MRTVRATGLLLLASAGFHFAVFLVLGGPWEGPVSWRKPVTFGVSFGLSVLTIAWIVDLLHLRGRLRAVLVGAFTSASVLEVALTSLQAWRGVPSHFNEETGFDTLVTRMLAFGGMVLILTVLTLTAASLRARPGVAPSMREALRAGLLALSASMAIGGVMIATGMARVNAGEPDLAYALAGSLRPAHAVTMHAVLLLPALAWLAARTLPDERARLRVVRAGIAVYAAVAAAVTALAATGVTAVGPGTAAMAAAGLVTTAGLAALAAGALRTPAEGDRERASGDALPR